MVTWCPFSGETRQTEPLAVLRFLQRLLHITNGLTNESKSKVAWPI